MEPVAPHPDEWAEVELSRIIRESGGPAWQVILALVNRAPEDLLDAVGVGPFEDWITEATATAYATQLRAEIATNRRFRQMISSAWELPSLIRDAVASAENESSSLPE